VIKRIELINFMSHRHTVIEPAQGLTVLVGPNNCGKSAFVTALQILCHNSASGFVLRHGEKKCEVIVETDDGHVIKWSRKKNGAGTYVVDGQPFDRLRGKVPDEVHRILKMPKVVCDKDEFDIHFGEQRDPVFLLKDRGKAAAQFFASSSDATHLVAMQHEHKSNVVVAKRDFKQLSSRQQNIQGQLDALEPLEGIDGELAKLEKKHAEIKSTVETIVQLEKLVTAISQAFDRFSFTGGLSKTFADLHKPPRLGDESALENVVERFKQSQSDFDKSSHLSIGLRNLTVPPQLDDCRPLDNVVAQIQNLSLRYLRSENLGLQFQSMDQPPVMVASDALESLIVDIREKATAFDSSQSATMALGKLEPMGIQENLSPVQLRIDALKHCERELEKAEQKLAIVGSAAEPPSQLAIDPMKVLMDEIKSKSLQVAERQNVISQVQEQLCLARVDIENWAAENPNCPTCGGQTDPSRFLQPSGKDSTLCEGKSHG
jgi:exonuclease SbcC